METSAAAVTVSAAVPVFPVAGSVALIVMGPPTDNAVANPLEPAALLMVATTKAEDVQLTDAVISTFELFE